MKQTIRQDGIRISKRTFLSTVSVLFAVIIAAGILTLVLPQGAYERITADGYEQIVADSYTEIADGKRLPVWRWLTAPFEVLAGEDGLVAIMIIIFLIFIGGTFLILERSGIMEYLLRRAAKRYGAHKYRLMAVIIFLFMGMGSAMGLFEETIPLVPFIVALALALGWDSLVGLGMSILAVGFGFACGTFNPFSILVAQEIAGLPVFSGLLFRLLSFALFYGLLLAFVMTYAKKIEKDPSKSLSYESDAVNREKYIFDPDEEASNPRAKTASLVFVSAFGLIALYIVVSLIMLYTGNDVLTGYTLPFVAVVMTADGLIAGRISGLRPKELFRDFGKGMLTMAPGALLIVMAMAAKQIVVAGGVMDTILHGVYVRMGHMSSFPAVLTVFAFVLVLEVFISSASAKAFIVIPLIVPFASLIDITRQTVVQSYCFADGFANIFFPTNAALLIALGLVNLSYGKWLKWSWKLTVGTVLLSVALLGLAVVTGYGPA